MSCIAMVHASWWQKDGRSIYLVASDRSTAKVFLLPGGRYLTYRRNKSGDLIRTKHGDEIPARNADGSLPWITLHQGCVLRRWRRCGER